jgi:hypothetical protein
MAKINTTVGNVSIKIDTIRLDRNLKEAQRLLTNQVWADCDPLIPFQQGGLKNSATMGINADYIQWSAPYAHAVYEGFVFTPNIPIKDSAGNITGWFSPPGKRKQKTDRKMQFHTPGTTDHFFEKAKRIHGSEWVRLVKETAGKD